MSGPQVAQLNDAAGIGMLPHKAKATLAEGGWRKHRQPGADQRRDERHRKDVDQILLEERSGDAAAAHEPDVAAGMSGADHGQELLQIARERNDAALRSFQRTMGHHVRGHAESGGAVYPSRLIPT